jgi:hypothetical protein
LTTVLLPQNKNRQGIWIFVTQLLFNLTGQDILGPMKNSWLMATCTTLVLAFSINWLAGCEEVLDVCQPCGSVLKGDITISGDPRLDGTFDAVGRVRFTATYAEKIYSEDAARLREAFDLPDDASMSQIVEEIRTQLIDAPGVDLTMGIESVNCWIDAAFARDTGFSCEERSECNISSSCRESDEPPFCFGFFAGTCPIDVSEDCTSDAGVCESTGCRGDCFVDSSDVSCGEACIGLCSLIDSLPCPGYCGGVCSGSGGCTAYDAAGGCAGFCDGLCTGGCHAEARFTCNGDCAGRCLVDAVDGQMCGGECRGACLNTTGERIAKLSDRCRGHLRPAGCDPACGDCQEMARHLAWAAMQCTPALPRIGITLSGEAAGNPEPVINKIRVFESALVHAAAAHARLALLVDAEDAAGDLQPADLAPGPGEALPGWAYLEDVDYVKSLSVVEERKYFPLSNLKARVGRLISTATSGDFMVAAGALSCVNPALEEAKMIMDQLIPVEEANDLLQPARSCPLSEDEAVAPCLYRIVDGWGMLLDLAR